MKWDDSWLAFVNSIFTALHSYLQTILSANMFNFKKCSAVKIKLICRHGHCEVVLSYEHDEQKEAISPTGAVEQMRQGRRLPDRCLLYGA